MRGVFPKKYSRASSRARNKSTYERLHPIRQCIFPVAISFEKSPSNSISMVDTEILLHWETCYFSLRIMKIQPFLAIVILLFSSKKHKIMTLHAKWMGLEIGC